MLQKQMLVAVLLGSVSLAACAANTPYKVPNVAAPAAFSGQLAGANANTAIDAAWWKAFANTELDRLVASALAGNNDMAAALARIAQAKADLKTANAALLPSLDASAGADYRRSKPSSGKTTTARSINGGLDVSYELDLFGRNAAAKSSAQYALQQSRYDADALALVTSAETANAFFSILGLRDRIAVASESYENASGVLRIIEARERAGAVTAIEVSRQKSVMGNALASLRSLKEQEKIALNALGVLLGHNPQGTSVITVSVVDIALPEIGIGVPSSLLRRRPDIAAAEAALQAANADINAARAALYPSVTLGAGFSVVKSPLTDPAATALTLASALAAPVFDGGARKAAVEKAKAREAELIAGYHKAILVAFQEVEDALEARASASERVGIMQSTVDDARTAYHLTLRKFEAGSVDLEAVLDAQETLLSTRTAYVTARADALQASVDLFKALGGGWQPE